MADHLKENINHLLALKTASYQKRKVGKEKAEKRKGKGKRKWEKEKKRKTEEMRWQKRGGKEMKGDKVDRKKVKGKWRRKTGPGITRKRNKKGRKGKNGG